MNTFNPIADDLKLLTVYRNIGLQLLQQLRKTMITPTYTVVCKPAVVNEDNVLPFTWLKYSFQTRIDVFFEGARLPKTALLATYLMPTANGKEEEIVSYDFTIDLNINSIFTIQDFAEPYLIDFHQNLKKVFSDNHNPFVLKFNDK